MKSPGPKDASRILVVYYSRTGHSRTLAKEIAHRLRADLQEIHALVDYQGGGWVRSLGYPRALLHSALRWRPAIEVFKRDIADYDLVIVGGPVWGGGVAAPVRSFLAKHAEGAREIAFFLTQDGRFGRKTVFRQLARISGKKPVAVLGVSSRELKNMATLTGISLFVAELKRGRPAETRKAA